MIWLLLCIALLAALWLHAEIGWADEQADRRHAEREAARLRTRNLRLAEYLWAEPQRPAITRIVATCEADAIEALIADAR